MTFVFEDETETLEIEILVPLSLPIYDGMFETTLILYPVPVVVLDGIIAEILPETVDVNVPILTRLAKGLGCFR